MKVSFGRKIAVLCLSTAMAFGVGFSLSGIKPVQAKAEAIDFVDILANYKLDSVVTITNEDVTGVKFPKELDVLGDKSVIASPYVLTYPDGASLSLLTLDTVTLSQLGKYEIAYKAVVNENITVYYDTFLVHNNFTSGTSSVSLHEKEVYDKYQKVSSHYVDGFKYGNVPESETTKKKVLKGVRATLSAGSSITFNNVIDSNVVDDEGFCNLFTYNATAVNRAEGIPNGKNEAPLLCTYFDFKFTDVNNPDNYFIVTSKNQPGSVGFTFGVSTATTYLIGTADTYIDNDVEKEGSKRIFYVDGVRNVAVLNKVRTWGDGEHEIYDYSIMYNPTTKVIKYKMVKPFDFKTGANNATIEDVIIDLDNPDIFDEGATLFSGFSTGEVKLTMQGREFSANEAYVDVYSLGTVEGEELQNYFKKDTIEDTTAPTIKVDVKQTSVNGVYSAYNPTDKNVKFYVPKAYAQDANECSDVTYKVYKNYAGGDSTKVLVTLNDDGSFTLTENVVYTIEYKTSDIYGNEGVKTLNVIPVTIGDLVAGDVSINEGIKAVYNKVNLEAGVTVDEPILSFVDTLNIKDDLVVKVSVTKGSEVLFNKTYGYAELSATNKPTFDFKPIVAGDYVVTYDFKDNVSHVTSSYTATCVATGKVEFASAPLLQKYYILGMTYEKPDFTAYKFGSTLEEVPTNVSVSYDGGSTWTEIGQTFVMGADSNGNYIPTASTVAFKYSSQGVDDYITASAPIVDVRKDNAIASGAKLSVKQKNKENLDITKLFATEKALVYADKTKLKFKASETIGDATVRFINPVTFDKLGRFDFKFDTDKSGNDYNEFTLKLIDAYDDSNSVYLNFFMINKETRLSINGGKTFASPFELHGSSMSFNYSVDSQMITIGTGNYNLPFTPTNNLFYIELTMGDITGDNAEMTISMFGNHVFRADRTYDTSSPMFYYNSAAGFYPLGSTVTIKAPYVADVLSSFVFTNSDGTRNAKISVKLVGGSAVRSNEGVLLDGTQDPTKDYTLTLNEYATWKVTYDVYDSAGLVGSGWYDITASDMVAPTISLNYGFNENTIHNVTLGKAFSIEYTVSDNVSQETKIKVGVIIVRDSDFFTIFSSKPHESLVNSEDPTPITDSCIITRRGLYTVYVLAIDEANNMAMATYKLNVQ